MATRRGKRDEGDEENPSRRHANSPSPSGLTDGDGFRLKDIDPNDTLNLKSEDKPREQKVLATGVQALASLQDMLYAQYRWAVLLILNA